jgi:PGF-pre-PGF domain-containing protein
MARNISLMSAGILVCIVLAAVMGAASGAGSSSIFVEGNTVSGDIVLSMKKDISQKLDLQIDGRATRALLDVSGSGKDVSVSLGELHNDLMVSSGKLSGNTFSITDFNGELSKKSAEVVKFNINYPSNSRLTKAQFDVARLAPDVAYDIPVLVLRYVPLDKSGRVDRSIVGGDLAESDLNVQNLRSKINRLNGQGIAALQKASTYKGFRDAQASPSLNHYIVNDIEHLERVPQTFFVLDGKPDSGKWSPREGFEGASLTIDFGSSQVLDYIDLYFYYIDRPERFHILSSSTGAFAGEEIEIVSERDGLAGYSKISSTSPIESKRYSFEPINARYVKLVVDAWRANNPQGTNGQINLYEIDFSVETSGASAYSPDASSRANARYYLNREGICDYVDNKGVKEVWMWMYHSDSVYPLESNMAMGRVISDHWNNDGFGDISNSAMDNDLPVCESTYTVYEFNYGRDLGEFMEDFGHQYERIFNFVDKDLFWNKFVGPYGNDAGARRCGWTHYTPNGKGDYDWNSRELVLSDCADWRPDGTGAAVLVNCETWSDNQCKYDGGVAWKTWWMQNFPGKGNDLIYRSQQLRNWWEFIGDFDSAIQRGTLLTEPFPTAVTASQGNLELNGRPISEGTQDISSLLPECQDISCVFEVTVRTDEISELTVSNLLVEYTLPAVDFATQINAYCEEAERVYPCDIPLYVTSSMDGELIIRDFDLVVDELVPIVSEISPRSGFDSGGTRVTITGSGFTKNTIVTFDEVAAVSVSVQGSKRIMVDSPPHRAGVVNVRVVNSDKAYNSVTEGFEYILTPCTREDWQCNAYPEECPSDGERSRTCTLLNDRCGNPDEVRPALVESCSVVCGGVNQKCCSGNVCGSGLFCRENKVGDVNLVLSAVCKNVVACTAAAWQCEDFNDVCPSTGERARSCLLVDEQCADPGAVRPNLVEECSQIPTEICNLNSICDGEETAVTCASDCLALKGSLNDLETNVESLDIKIDNSAPGERPAANSKVTFSEGEQPVLEFEHDFSQAQLDVSKIKLEKQRTGRGLVWVKGLVLDADTTKTIFLEKAKAKSNAFCVIDADVDELGVLSEDCSNPDEILLKCDGNQYAGYLCENTGSHFKISGLRHSVVFELVEISMPKVPTPVDSTNTSDGSVILSWAAVDEDVEGNALEDVAYLVFRVAATDQDPNITALSTVRDPLSEHYVGSTEFLNFTDSTVRDDSMYSYAITANSSDAYNDSVLNFAVNNNTATINVSRCITSYGSWSLWGGCSSGSQSRARHRICRGDTDSDIETRSCTVNSAAPQSSGGGGGGGGGSVLSAEAVRAMTPLESGTEGKFVFSKFSTIAVAEINVVSAVTNKNPQIAVRETKVTSGVPDSIPPEIGLNYKFLSITQTGIRNITDATIKFKIPRTWFISNELDPSTTSLSRLVSNQWMPAPTRQTASYDDYFSFESRTQGFSIFAISANRTVNIAGELRDEQEPLNLSPDMPVQPVVAAESNGSRIQLNLSAPNIGNLTDNSDKTGNSTRELLQTIVLLVIAALIAMGTSLIGYRYYLDHHPKRAEPNGAEDRLTRYVRARLSKGSRPEEIKESLIQAGWSGERVSEVLSELLGSRK